MWKQSAAVAVALALVAGVRAAEPPVTLAEDAASFTLANGQVTARINKQSGTFSLRYKDLEVVRSGYWSQVGRSSAGDIAQFGAQRSASVRLDPAKNDGARAEVSCRFVHDGKGAGLPVDVDLRYGLGRGDSGLSAYAVWQHRPGQPGFSVGEARIALKLNRRLRFPGRGRQAADGVAQRARLGPRRATEHEGGAPHPHRAAGGQGGAQVRLLRHPGRHPRLRLVQLDQARRRLDDQPQH
jgi:hypothetical protein